MLFNFNLLALFVIYSRICMTKEDYDPQKVFGRYKAQALIKKQKP